VAFLPVSQHVLSSQIGRSLYTISGKNSYIFCLAMLSATYISHCSSTRHVQNLMKSQLYTYLVSEGHLVLPLSVAQFDRVCTQFEEKSHALWQLSMDSKPYIKLAKGCLNTAFFGHRVLYTILGKTSYTLIRLTKHGFAIL